MADYFNKRIQVFTSEGKFLRMKDIEHSNPTGVAVDTNSMVYVSGAVNGSVYVCTLLNASLRRHHSEQWDKYLLE